MNRKLYFYAAKNISPFVETELQRLRKVYSVHVVCGKGYKGVLEGVEITQLEEAFSFKQKLQHFFQRPVELFTLILSEASVFGLRRNLFYHLRSSFNLLIDASLRCEMLKSKVSEVHAIHYAFFANDYALLLALAKRRGYVDSFVCRAHGRDVIEEREPITQQLPFQWLKFQEATMVYGVSKMTSNYLQERYPACIDKFKVSYLGSVDSGVASIPSKSEYTIISVGRVRNVKRFHLVGELIKNSEFSIRWIHCGEQDSNDPDILLFRSIVKELESNPKVEIDHRGGLAHRDLLNLLKTTPIDLLINTSSYEGLPVSIQEALSFGIPCMATDVGGTSDIVNDQTGLLMPSDFTPNKEARRMDEFLQSNARNKNYRLGIRRFWEKHLNADENFKRFISDLRDAQNNP